MQKYHYSDLWTERYMRRFHDSNEKVFDNISDEDFWSVISAEIDDYNFNSYNARYFASNILILGRILSFKIKKQILSKYDAGIWMMDYVPKELKYLPEEAMKIWFDGEEVNLPEKDLNKLKMFLIDEIKKYN